MTTESTGQDCGSGAADLLAISLSEKYLTVVSKTRQNTAVIFFETFKRADM